VTDERRVQWYDNKELFEMVRGLESALTETNSAIRKYNGLHEKIDDLDDKMDIQIKRCNEVQTRRQTHSDVFATIKSLWPIILSTIIFILAVVRGA
jgi:hypothetical protein